ncbi:Vacuolar protein-sorting-associated protein 60 [Malassezia japonica]|uniref:Vacuolar protein-sorting-associated protein 60 n=1 Tax=Malassezia japonica TaxID=223818 RepID=A0AAF0JI01_9BASI|nr:Vacuolar protein-sorting-associated protein 60 [Malassezia japonica]WFD41281.1 Vacuolar protein-sorting-associated protein 60 [Malassezia japonica]
MYRLLGLSQNKPKPDLQQAISSTDERADATQVKISRLDAELGRYRDQMKRMRDGPGKSAVQQRALRVLKQKRMYEAQIEQLTQQSFNMEQSMMTTENLRNTMATVDAMQVANKEMRRTYGNLNIDKIEQIQDDMEDLLEQSSAIQETMSRSYGVPDDIDETELEAELEALEEDPGQDELEVPSYLQHATMAPSQPDFVDELPTENKTEAEAELRAA